jgi:hypothetical protein
MKITVHDHNDDDLNNKKYTRIPMELMALTTITMSTANVWTTMANYS